MMDLTPEDYQTILQAGTPNPEREQLARQQILAQGLRERAMLQSPQQPMAGGRVLPNWSNVASNLFGAYRAHQAMPEINAGMQRFNQQDIDARKQYLQILMRALRQGQVQGTGPQAPNPAAAQPGAVPGEPGPGTGNMNY